MVVSKLAWGAKLCIHNSVSHLQYTIAAAAAVAVSNCLLFVIDFGLKITQMFMLHFIYTISLVLMR